MPMPMRYSANRKVINTTIYTVLGVVIVALLTVTIATFVGMQSKDQQDRPAELPTDTSLPAVKPTPAPTPSEKPTTPAVKPTTPVSPTPSHDSDTSKKDDPVQNLVMHPAEGAIQKEHSIDLPVFSLTMNDYRAHTGVDIAAEPGSAVVSISDGTIENIYSDPMMGMTIVINHGDGLLSYYKNLATELPTDIVKGATVKTGTVIGAVGNTSLIELADADHLHFELTQNGKQIDPLEYFEASGLSKP